MAEFIYQQTVVQWRIPVKADGKLGTPEIVKKFTTEWNGSQNKHKKKPSKKVELRSTQSEVLEL